MKNNNIFAIFLNTLVNPLFYKELRNESFKKAFGYLYLLLILFGIVQSVIFGIKLKTYFPLLVSAVGEFRS
ncbi:MAG: hypothetical protein AAB893_02675, partial [Patescibacteria group bacterium]